MSTARNDAARPQNDASPGSAGDRLDLEENISRAQDLNRLAQWISEARDLADNLQLSANIDPVLAERLRANDIAFNSPEWGTFESCALHRLHMIIEENIRQIADATINVPRSVQ